MTMIRVVGLADLKYKLEIDALAATDPGAGQTLKQVSILFLDVVGSTTLSESLDPEEIHAGSWAARHSLQAKDVLQDSSCPSDSRTPGDWSSLIRHRLPGQVLVCLISESRWSQQRSHGSKPTECCPPPHKEAESGRWSRGWSRGWFTE